MYRKEPAEVCALKVKLCFVGIWCSRTCICNGMGAGGAGSALSHTLLFADALDLPKAQLLCLGFPFCKRVQYPCECSVFGLKCMG